MLRKLALCALTSALCTACATAEARWWQSIFGSSDQEQTQEAPDSDAGAARQDDAELSGRTIEDALRRALLEGTRAAVDQLGRRDGFWADPQVRIPLPPSLERTTDLIRRLGGGSAVDDFHMTLNRAAENAVPQAAEVFTQAVRNMTLRDVRDILAGADDAATRYFRQQTEEELARRFRPIVAQSVEQAGVGSAYQSLVQRAGPYAGALGAPDDLEGYVTERALDRLYQRVALEEAAIRANPAGRGSDLLEQVFGRR